MPLAAWWIGESVSEFTDDQYEPTYERQGNTHILRFPCKIELSLSRISVGKDDIKGWLDARSRWDTGPERLIAASFNLSGPRARKDMAKDLAERCPVPLDWGEILERACTTIVDVLAEGSPVVKLSDIQRREGSKFRVEPIAFEGMPVIWFGRGGSGKSLLAAAAAIAIHGNVDLLGLPLLTGPVMINDWETDGATYREQIELICDGHGIAMPDIFYRECFGSLNHEGEAIGRFIDANGVQVTFNDSLGMASGADKNSQETATGMFTMMRSWRTSNICIDHIAKGEETNTPYGSVYFENAARATWRAKGTMKDGSNEHFLILSMEKTNLGKYPPVGFKFTFLPDTSNVQAITVEKIDVSTLPTELKADKMNAKDSIRAALKESRRAMNVTDMVEATGMSEPKLRARIGEMVGDGSVIKIIIRGAANKYALKSAFAEEEVGG